jgi:hypothetical protein
LFAGVAGDNAVNLIASVRDDTLRLTVDQLYDRLSSGAVNELLDFPLMEGT